MVNTFSNTAILCYVIKIGPIAITLQYYLCWTAGTPLMVVMSKFYLYYCCLKVRYIKVCIILYRIGIAHPLQLFFKRETRYIVVLPTLYARVKSGYEERCHQVDVT